MGTALPVILFALAIAAGAGAVARVFQQVAAFERWARIATRGLFLAVSLYFSLNFIFHAW